MNTFAAIPAAATITRNRIHMMAMAINMAMTMTMPMATVITIIMSTPSRSPPAAVAAVVPRSASHQSHRR
ncbi:hypothetical protein [Cupriavidus numazuensis]|uniref:hypothetical protein n=1 Tax=Cupriavidus numazuensis TaxID=221992 RepID=UPI00360B4AAD